jgi:hypothetical protein
LVAGAEEAETCKGEGKLVVAAVVVYVVGLQRCWGDKEEGGKDRRLTWHGERLVGPVVDRWWSRG